MGLVKALVDDINLKGCTAVTVSDTTAVVSGIVNTAGYGSATCVIFTGTLADADATFSVLIEHDDVVGFGTAAAVPDAELVGTEALAGFTFALDSGARKIGYRGTKQFVRATVTPVANTGSAPIAVGWVLGHPRSLPQANPPA